MIPRLGINMTTSEAEQAIGLLVQRGGFAWVLRTALAAGREEAGRKASEAEQEFARLNAVGAAAGMEEGG